MTAVPGEPTTFEILLGLLRDANRPIIWIGAGLSVAAGLPTVWGLMDALRKRDLRRRLPAGEADFTKVVDAFVGAYGGGELNDFMQAQFAAEGIPTAVHRAIARLAGAGHAPLIITTNYDTLVERALADAKVPCLVQVLDRNFHLAPASQVRVLKIHGDRSDWASTILSGASYAESERRYRRLFQELDLLLTRHRVVFLGCSMQDPRVLDWLASRDETARRQLKLWAPVMRPTDWQALSEAQHSLLTQFRVEPLTFETFDELPKIFERLADVLPPDTTKGRRICLTLDPGETTWTVTGPGAAIHQVPNPLGSGAPLLDALNALRDLVPQPVVVSDPRSAAVEARANALARAVGTTLASILLADASRTAITRAMQGDRPTLVVRVESRGELADRALALPWELLWLDDCHPVHACKLDVARDAAPEREKVSAPPTTLPETLSLAVCLSAPTDQTALDYEQEEYRLVVALKGHQSAFTDLGELNDLTRVVERHGPVGVHFSGHGLPGGLVFEDEEGLSKVVPVAEVLRALRAVANKAGQASRMPRFFFLSSCHGASNTDGPALEGTREARTARDAAEVALGEGPSTAATLHREGLAYVVGYFGPVGDALATQAEVAFYGSLGAGHSVLQAVADTREALSRTLKLPSGLEVRYPLGWAQLAIYHHGEDLPLVKGDQMRPEQSAAPFDRAKIEVNGLPVLSHGFIGRRRTLHELRKRLKEGQKILLLQGLGGLGKTALATRLLKTLASDAADQLILRAQDAKDVAGLERQARQHGGQFGGPDWSAAAEVIAKRHPDDLVAAFEATVRALRARRPGLVLYVDNLESLQVDLDQDGAELTRWRDPLGAAWWAALERLSHGPDAMTVLASSRYAWQGLRQRFWLKVPPLPVADMLRMVSTFRDLRTLPWKVQRVVARKADGRPRTLKLLDGLVGELDPQPKHEQGWLDWVEALVAQTNGVLTQDLALASLWEALPRSAQAHAIALSVLNQPAPSEVVEALGDQRVTLERTSLLTRHSVIRPTPSGLKYQDRFGLHSVVAAFVATHRTPEAQQMAQIQAGEAYVRRRQPEQLIFDDERESGLLLCAAGKGDAAWPVLKQPIWHLRDLARYGEARALIDLALAARPTGDHLASALGLWVQMAKSMGDFESDLDMRLAEAEAAASDKELGFILSERATLSFQRGDYELAERLLRSSLAAERKEGGIQPRDEAVSLYELARVLVAKGEDDEAERRLLEALEIFQTKLTEKHPMFPSCLTALASLWRRQGRYLEAEEFLAKSLFILEGSVGKNHPSYASALRSWAEVLQAQGRFDRAEQLLRSVLGILEGLSLTTHPTYPTTVNNLAVVLSELGKHDEAEQLERRALGIQEKTVGKEHPGYATALTNLAQSVARRDALDGAHLALDSLGIFERKLGTDHPTTQGARWNFHAIMLLASKSVLVGRTQALSQLIARLQFAERNRALAIVRSALSGPRNDSERFELLLLRAQLELGQRNEEAQATLGEARVLADHLGPRANTVWEQVWALVAKSQKP